MTQPFTLYGMTASLYTAKVRAYMRRNGVPFKEVKAGSAHYSNVIRKSVGRWIVPVIETPEGELIQDGSVILDHFEEIGWSEQSIFAADPRLNIIAHLFELFGGEGLLRPAMHYRWNFDDTNLNFLKVSFEDVLPDGLNDAEYLAGFEHASGLMRKATLFFGATPNVVEEIEQSYSELLGLLDDHFRAFPFLLGGYPTIGDYAMFGPLWAHLGRDPKPLHLMQTTAPRVHRWTERMNMREQYEDGLSERSGKALVQFEELPSSLLALMRYVSDEYLPEITAHIDFANNWLATTPDPRSAHNPKERFVGAATFGWRGTELTTAVAPYRFFLLQRLQDAFDQLDQDDQGQVRAVFETSGLAPILDTRVGHRVVRRNYIEEWE